MIVIEVEVGEGVVEGVRGFGLSRSQGVRPLDRLYLRFFALDRVSYRGDGDRNGGN